MSIRGKLVLLALLFGGIVPAPGDYKEEARSAELPGVFLVCKEYGTVRGTFLTSVRGRDIARLNFLFGEEVDPRLSPAGDRILFTSTRGGSPGVWTMDRKGQQQKRVCDGDQGNWFSDGRRILFRRQGQIVERSLDNGRETVLSPADWQSCSWPACCPDGRRILFVAHQAGKEAICLITPGEAEPKRLAEGGILGAPRWSPSGQRIVYQCGPHLWMIDADGSNKRQLTTAGGIQRHPAWSPDGSAIAYCRGPGPKGPWQMAVISIDGARKIAIPPGSARSVLCADWGLEEPGRRAEPKETSASPPPDVRLWKIDQPVTEAPADWAAFCRERKGWSAIPAENAPHQGLPGGCAAESRGAVLLLSIGRAGAALIPGTAEAGAIQFTLLDSQGKEVGPVESIRVLACGPDEVTLESSSHSAGAPVKAAWTVVGSRALVRVTPLENAGKIRVAAPMECVVVPDRFGNDVVADPASPGEDRSLLPWAPLVVGLLGGSDLLLLIRPEQDQTAELRRGNGPSFACADAAFQNHGVWFGVIRSERAWHLERIAADGAAEPLRLNWRMPYAANWRLTVQGGREQYSALFSDKESALFDKESVLFPNSNDLAAPVRLGLIYLYGRTAGTPPEALTPLDLIRDALGLEAARQVLDEEGLSGYRRAAGPTTWAELSVTLESLEYLFERELEVQDGVYARHLCDDLPSFVKGMDERLKEYADFSREIQTLCERKGKPSPPAARLLEDLAAVAQKLRELDERQQGLRSSEELLPVCARIKELTTTESSGNRRQFEQSRGALLKIVGAREELLRTYRKLAVEARDSAGRRLQDGPALLVQAELLGLAEKIRALCQRVLRNRFYTEADWRGEDYNVPGFWLGPRPYE